MSTDTKLKLLFVFSLICLLALLFQGYLLWQVQAQLVSEAETHLPQSIEQRLDEALTSPRYRPSQVSPFGLLGQSFGSDPLRQMQQQIDSLFGTLPMSSAGSFGSFSMNAGAPELSLMETDTEYQVAVTTAADTDVEINTELEANLLTVRGSVTQDFSDSSNALTSSFVSRSQFTRSFDLPKPVDELGVFTEATKSGLLIHVPKKK